MSSVIVLFAAALSGQVGQGGAFELRNQIQDQPVSVWLRSRRSGQWLYNKQPIVLRPRQSVRLNLGVGRYQIYLRTRSNSTLVMDRQLAPGEVDRLRIGDPPPPPGGGMVAAPQMRIFEVRDDYGYSENMNSPPMELPVPPRLARP